MGGHSKRSCDGYRCVFVCKLLTHTQVSKGAAGNESLHYVCRIAHKVRASSQHTSDIGSMKVILILTDIGKHEYPRRHMKQFCISSHNNINIYHPSNLHTDI